MEQEPVAPPPELRDIAKQLRRILREFKNQVEILPKATPGHQEIRILISRMEGIHNELREIVYEERLAEEPDIRTVMLLRQAKRILQHGKLESEAK